MCTSERLLSNKNSAKTDFCTKIKLLLNSCIPYSLTWWRVRNMKNETLNSIIRSSAKSFKGLGKSVKYLLTPQSFSANLNWLCGHHYSINDHFQVVLRDRYIEVLLYLIWKFLLVLCKYISPLIYPIYHYVLLMR